MKKLNAAVSLVGVVLAGGLLLVSIWRQVDKQAYAQAVSKEVQEMMEGESMGEGERERVGPGGELGLPGDWNYYPRVVGERVSLWLVRDERRKVEMMVALAEERGEMGERLLELGKQALAVKTVNKAVHYLEQATDALDGMMGGDEELDDMWMLVYKGAEGQEKLVTAMKGEVHDLAGPAMDDLCRRLGVLQDRAAGHVEIGG